MRFYTNSLLCNILLNNILLGYIEYIFVWLILLDRLVSNSFDSQIFMGNPNFSQIVIRIMLLATLITKTKRLSAAVTKPLSPGNKNVSWAASCFGQSAAAALNRTCT